MEKLSNRIIERLLLIDETPSEIKPFMIDYLLVVDKYIENIENRQDQAIETLKLKAFNIKAVSELLGISRTTPYNHNALIKRYIDISESLLREHNPLDQLSLQKEINQKLKNDIEMLYDRDITLEIQKQRSRTLTDRLNEKKKEIERLEVINRELSLENQVLKRATKNQSPKTKNIKSIKD